MFYVSIEGTVGVGKSTLLRLLSNCKDIGFNTFAREPVQKFQELVGGYDLLALSYQDPKKYAACAHTHILRILHEFFHEQLKEDKKVVLERCHLSPQVFVIAHLAEGNIQPVVAFVLEEFRAHLFKDLPVLPDCIIFLDTTLEKCLQRIAKRDRKAESCSSDTFFSTLYEAYQVFMTHLQSIDFQRVYVLDASEDVDTVFQKARNILKYASFRKEQQQEQLCIEKTFLLQKKSNTLNAMCLELPNLKCSSSHALKEVQHKLLCWGLSRRALKQFNNNLLNLRHALQLVS